jgi:5-bromo-4-chloroindolyl phosphate hydrolysis protein
LSPPPPTTPNAISTTKNFLETLNTVEQDWANWITDIQQCESETQDLLHEIELTKFDVQRGYKLAKQLQEIRQRRRELKDTVELLRNIKDFLDCNKQLKISLFKTLTSMERVEENQGQRMYAPRVRTDITLAEKLG